MRAGAMPSHISFPGLAAWFCLCVVCLLLGVL